MNPTAAITAFGALPLPAAAGTPQTPLLLGLDEPATRRALAEREIFSRLLESSGEFAAVCGTDARLSFINAGWLPKVGLVTRAQALELPLSEHLAEAERGEPLAQVLAEAREQGQARAELRFRHFAGGVAPWVLLNVHLLRDEQGQPTGFGLVGVDITERKRAELALSSEKAILEKIALRAPLHEVLEQLALSVEAQTDSGMLCSVLLADASGRRLLHGAAPSLPPAYNAAINGIEIGPDVGSCGSAAFERRPVFVTDIASDPRWAAFLPLAQEHGLDACCSLPVLAGDGRLLGTVAMYYRHPHTPGTTDVALIRNAGHLAAIVIERMRDERERRGSEARFRTLADAIPHIVWTADAEGGWDYANERWTGYTGEVCTSDAGATGRIDWLAQVHPDDHDSAARQWRESLDAGQPCAIEVRLRARSGEHRWHQLRALPLADDGGPAQRWIGTCTDIEDDRRLAQEREELLAAERNARGEMERAMRLRDDFVATLSHELRTPLTSIIGWTAVLRRAPPDAATLQRAIDVIDRNARLQTQMVEDLLDMSRILSGKLRLDVQRLDLAPVIEAAIDTVRPAADAKGVKLLPVFGSAGIVRGDPARLQQVVWNLLSNAIKFTPREGRVQLTHRRAGSHIEISVIDTGQGIAPEFLPHVFDRFRQADSSITRQKGGLGLGLSIVRSIVEMHGGTVEAHSAGPAQGSTFTVRLPLAVLHEATPPLPGAAAPAAAPGAEQLPNLHLLQGLSLLVLDDDTDSRELVTRVLCDEGAQVHGAASAAEALELLQSLAAARTPVDALLSDIGLPGEDGYSFIRKVRRLGTPSARVTAIALTALARSEDRRRALMAGFQTHVAKPVDPAELVAVVATLCGRTGMEAAAEQ
jgi:PAS domain S-box-containing protein